MSPFKIIIVGGGIAGLAAVGALLFTTQQDDHVNIL